VDPVPESLVATIDRRRRPGHRLSARAEGAAGRAAGHERLRRGSQRLESALRPPDDGGVDDRARADPPPAGLRSELWTGEWPGISCLCLDLQWPAVVEAGLWATLRRASGGGNAVR